MVIVNKIHKEKFEEICTNYTTSITLYTQAEESNSNLEELVAYSEGYFQSRNAKVVRNDENLLDSDESWYYYFIENEIEALQKKYERHIHKIEDMRREGLDSLFHTYSSTTTNSYLNTSAISDLLSFMESEIDSRVLNSLHNNLHEFISQDIGVNIDYQSLLNYLYILPSKKIQRSEIAIDNDSGKIIIIYNADKSEFSSKKISIIANAKDFTVSVISRKSGLAKFSGVYASKFPEAYYKIESLMETLF